jgi:hypothetical protein
VDLTVNEEQFTHEYQVSSTNLAPVDDLVVYLGPFNGPQSTQTDVTCTLQGVEVVPCPREPAEPAQNSIRCTLPGGSDGCAAVAGLVSFQVEVSSSLPYTGTYTSAMNLAYNQQLKSTKLSVTRSSPPLPVQVLGVNTGSGETRQPVSLWMTLIDISGQPLQMNQPELESLNLQGETSSDKDLQAKVGPITVKNTEGITLTETIELNFQEPTRLNLLFNNISQAGTYEGNLLLSASGYRILTQPITFLVRDPWWVAFLLIALSASLLMLLSWLVKSYQPKLAARIALSRWEAELRQQVEDVRALLAGNDKAREKIQQIVDGLRFRLGDLRTNLKPLTDQEYKKEVEDLGKKIRILRRVADAYLRVAALHPSLAEKHQAALDSIHKKMLAESSTSGSEATEELNQLFDKILEDVKKWLLGQLASMETGLAAKLDLLKDQPDLHVLAGKLQERITDAKKTVENDQLELAAAEFDMLRLDYAKLFAEQITRSLTKAIPGVPDDEWPNTQAQIKGQLQAVALAKTGDEAIERYQDGYTLYMKIAIAALMALTKKPPASGQTPIPADTIKTVQEKLEEATKLINASPPDPDGARKHYENALVTWTTASGSAGFKKIDSGAELAWSVMPASPAKKLDQPPGVLQDLPMPVLLFMDTGIRIIVGLLALAVTTAVGMYLLYSKDPTWGGWQDWLVAILWGLGIFQVSNQTFGGAAAWLEKIRTGQGSDTVITV